MKINSIHLKNFKNFSDRLFNFTDFAEISGVNGSGKSAIKEAILFALYNRVPEGQKETDKYISHGENFTEVELKIDGKEIRRQRSKSSSKVWLGGNQITQQKLEEELNLPSYEVFASIFDVGFFMKLDEKTQRQIILDLTEEVNRLELFKKLGGLEEVLEFFDVDLDDLEDGFKKVNAFKLSTKKQLEENKTKQGIYVEELSKLKPTKPMGIIEDQIKEAKEYLEKIEKGIEKEEEHNKKVEKYQDIKYLIDEKKQLEVAIKEYPEELRNVHPDGIKKIEKEREELLEEKEKTYLVGLPEENVCPTCQQSITKERRDLVEQQNDENSKKLVGINSRIRLLTEAIGNWGKLELDRKSLDKVNSKLSQFKDIESYKDKELKDLSGLKSSKEVLEFKIQQFKFEMKTKEDSIKDKEKYETYIKALKEAEVECQGSIVKSKKIAEILSPKGLPYKEMEIKLDPLKKNLKEKIDGIDVILLEMLKTQTGYRQVFKILVNGTEYRFLSTGEKKKIDVVLSEVINDLLGKKFQNSIDTYFIDNCENLSGTIKPSLSQYFMSTVSSEELKVINM